MKKILLPAALLLFAAASVNAQSFSDFFKVSYNGVDYAPGSTITITDSHANVDDASLVDYFPHIKVANLDVNPRALNVKYDFLDPASEEEGYGFAQVCWTNAYATNDLGQFLKPDACIATMPVDENVAVKADSDEALSLDIHQEEVDPAKVVTFTLTLGALDDLPDQFAGWTYTEEICNASFTVKFCSKDNAAVEGVEFDENAPKEYFDLQGRRVVNPDKGIYILKQGSKVVKVVR